MTGDTERAPLPAGLGDIHPPDRPGRPRLGLVLHPAGQVSPGLRGQHHLPVNACRPAASIELGHPPHADQRVRPRPEHQLLQTADLLKVPRLRRREDPLPQPPYVPLGRTPVHRMPARRLVLRSVRHSSRRGVQLALRFQRRCHRQSSRAHLTRVSALSGPGTSPVSGQLSTTASGGASHASWVPAAFRPPASASRVILFPPGNWAFLTVGLPGTAPGPGRGFHVPHLRDTTGVGASSTPGTAVLPCPDAVPGQRLPLRSGQSLPPRTLHPIAGVLNHGASTEVHTIHPPGLPLACGLRMRRGPSGFPLCSAPRRYRRRTTGRGQA